MEQRGNWQAGEEVEMSARRDLVRLVTIDRVTPTGIAVIGPRRFGPDGRQHGSISWSRHYIRRVAPERRAAVLALSAFNDDRDAVERHIYRLDEFFRSSTAEDAAKMKRIAESLAWLNEEPGEPA